MVIDVKDIKSKIPFLIRGILVFLLFFYSAYFQLIPIKLFHLDVHNLSDTENVILSTFSSIVVVLILIAIYWKELKKDFSSYRKNIMENLDIGIKYWMSGLAIMMISNLIITFVFKAGGANNEELVQNMIHSLPWLMVIDAGILAPFNEEMVFRKTLKDIFNQKWIFVICSFLLFGGAHVINNATNILDYLYIIPYGALGGAFALAVYKSDNIFTSISMHMFHNLVLVLLSIFVL